MDRRVVAQLFDCIDQIKTQNQYISQENHTSDSQDDDYDPINKKINKSNKPVILIAATNR